MKTNASPSPAAPTAVRSPAQTRAIVRAQNDLLNAFHRRERAVGDVRAARKHLRTLTGSAV